MSIALPPMPDPSNPPPPASRINPRMRPINKLQSLKHYMKEAQVHTFSRNAIPPFPISLSSGLLSNQSRLAKKDEDEFMQIGKRSVRKTIEYLMKWGDDLFWKTSTSVTTGHGFRVWLSQLQGKDVSANDIRNQAQAFLILIGQRHEDLDLERLSAGLSFCLTHFGDIYIRWQPNRNCDDPEEAMWRTDNLFYCDYLQMSPELPLPSGNSLLKRKHEDDGATEESDDLQRPATKQRRVMPRRRTLMPASKTPAEKNEADASGASNLAVVRENKSDTVKKVARNLKVKFKQAVVEVVRSRPVTRSMTRRK